MLARTEITNAALLKQTRCYRLHYKRCNRFFFIRICGKRFCFILSICFSSPAMLLLGSGRNAEEVGCQIFYVIAEHIYHLKYYLNVISETWVWPQIVKKKKKKELPCIFTFETIKSLFFETSVQYHFKDFFSFIKLARVRLSIGSAFFKNQEIKEISFHVELAKSILWTVFFIKTLKIKVRKLPIRQKKISEMRYKLRMFIFRICSSQNHRISSSSYSSC